MRQNEHVRNIAIDLVLTVLTCFLYNVYLNYRQMLALNAMLGREKYRFWEWALLSLLTCGLYHIYHEWRMTTDLGELAKDKGDSDLVIVIVCLCFGLTPIVDAIQQTKINKFYGNTDL